MNESFIEKKICNLAKQNNWLVYKFISPSNKGVPDRMFLKNKIIFFIEFKNQKNKLSKLQEQTILKIKKNGFHVFIVNNIIQGKIILKEMNKLTNE